MATSDLLSHLKHMIWLVEVELKEDGGHIVANAKAAVAEAEAKTQPTFPKFYRGFKWSALDAFIRFDNAEHPGKLFRSTGQVIEMPDTFADVPEILRRGSWYELSEEQALLLVPSGMN